MKVRFGYVSTALALYDASPSKTLTFKRYSGMTDEARRDKLLAITEANLNHTMRMLYYNAAHELELYRLSSSIVPLATHPDVQWDFISPFKSKWKAIGDFIKQHKLRVSFHPNQFTLFTSPRKEVTTNAVGDMAYHYRMFEAMGIEYDSYMNIHIGGAYGDKPASLKRFHENIKGLPLPVKKQMTLENDDKTYTAAETLLVCEQEGIPFVFDYHHHMANPCEEPLEELMPRIYNTWMHTGLPPKIHISSPKSDKAYRSHSDFVSLDFIKPFLDLAKKLDADLDFMIEAKSKDLAALQLIEDIAKLRGAKRISGGAVTL
ncbi:UV DNA damage repair endonuclease UvsE [Bacillus testis]|uniref:UV DNA damage repair endonuclease UvsE n=1 Tax=Bacillus testis TaxID=1622072 RepID=UPI00067ECDCA|nr:UV DNA damage repair endonuclease UvsE [Bacillus testis]